MRPMTPRNIRRNARKLIRDIRHRGLGEPWMTVEPRDCFLASFPRSGNTWLRHILYSYMTGAEGVDMTTLDAFCPIIDGVDLQRHIAAQGDAPHRFIKTHELGAPYLLNGKVVFLVRDGRDATWSWHRFRMVFNNETPDFGEFLEASLADRHRYYSWPTNVASWMPLIESERVLLLRFEEMRADPEGVFARVLDHFGIPSVPERIAEAVELSTPRKVADTFRSELRAQWTKGDGAGQGGTVERWRTQYTPEQLELFEARAGDLLTRLGYPLGSRTSGAAEPVAVSA